MRRQDRAKQFMPYAALTGLEEALQKKDRAYREKILHEYERIPDPEFLEYEECLRQSTPVEDQNP